MLIRLSRVRYRVTLFESEEGWAVSCPDLPGCHSQGATREEALVNIKDAIRLWLEVEAEETGLKRIEQAEVAV
jgi:predicted RNase H-like HicB family nuclease